MKMRTRLFVSIPLLVALCSATLGYAESLRTVTGLNYIDKARAFDGYTLFAALGDGTTYLLDMEGNVVNSWPITGNPQLLDNGNLLAGSRGRFTELDWDGDIVWSYEETRSNYVPHHDFVRRYNPKLGEMTTFYIANRDVSQEECVAMGCDPANDYTGASIDTIVEINMDGEIIWDEIYSGTNIDIGRAIVKNQSGGFTVLGQTSSYGAGEFDFWVLKMDENGIVPYE